MRRDALAWGAVALLALLWGYTWVVVKVATGDASPFLVAAVRAAGGTVALFALLAALRRPLAPTPFVPTLVLGLLQTTLFTVLQTVAVALAGAGKVAILVYTMPFWVALLAWPFLGERIAGAKGAAALLLAALGLAFVVAPLDLAHGLVGDLLAVAGGIVWAASAIWAKRMRAAGTTDLLRLTAWQMLWGALPLVAVAASLPERLAATPGAFAALAWLALVAQALAWVLWGFVLSRLPAGVAGLASLATPVVGVAAAALQLREIPGRNELIGIVLIVAALVVNALPSRSAQPQPQPAPSR